MKIRSRKNLSLIKTVGLVLVLILAVVTIIKIDLSMQAYAASATSDNVAQAIDKVPEFPVNPLPEGTVTSPWFSLKPVSTNIVLQWQ